MLSATLTDYGGRLLFTLNCQLFPFWNKLWKTHCTYNVMRCIILIMYTKQDFINYYSTHTNKEVAEKFNLALQTVKNKAHELGLRKNVKLKVDNKNNPKEDKMEKKTGVEPRNNDQIIINWTTKTIITHLGEYKSFTCSFSMHNAIQRYYVDSYEGKGHTQAETAMKFDFPHAKAVAIYAKLHGFTKSSPGQTDIEIEEGLTVEDAVQDNLQAVKRQIVRKTEIAKWRQTQKDADSWNSFEHSVLYPMKDWVDEHLPKYRPPKVKLKKSPIGKFAGVVGISDWHYLKYCFDHRGKTTYNRKFARKALETANNHIVSKLNLYGQPEVLFIPSGTDNYHIDGYDKTTTAGTPQTRQTDGDWELDMEVFMDTIIGMIEFYSQVAPVKLIPMRGNHDSETSVMMHTFLQIYFKNSKDVTVVKNHAPRVYQQYGKNAFMFQHGKSPSTPKFRREVQKYFLVEAKEQGINLNYVKHLNAFTGDLHHDSFVDLGGVKHFIIPSLTPADSWHQTEGFVGSAQEASLYIFGRNTGREDVLYSR